MLDLALIMPTIIGGICVGFGDSTAIESAMHEAALKAWATLNDVPTRDYSGGICVGFQTGQQKNQLIGYAEFWSFRNFTWTEDSTCC